MHRSHPPRGRGAVAAAGLLASCLAAGHSGGAAAFQASPTARPPSGGRRAAGRHSCGGRPRHRRAPPTLRSGADDDARAEDIFFDDFSGQSIGEILPAENIVAPEEEDEDGNELPDFDDDAVRPADDGLLASADWAADPARDRPIAIPLPAPDTAADLTGATRREFSLGAGVVLTRYAGALGFDQVTDWQYYEIDERTGARTPVAPRPTLDGSQPARTKSSSGSVVRLFVGEVWGRLAGKMRSRGVDPRVLVKEFSGEEAISLAMAEKKGLGRLQSAWLDDYLRNNNKYDMGLEQGEWIGPAQRRYVDGLTNTPTNLDDENLITLLELLVKHKAPFVSLLGELNLMDYFDDDDKNPNEWYKALGVKPPQPGSVWLVYDYHGLSTAASYAVPALVRRSQLPPRRGPFGGIIAAPPLPPFKERARYVVVGVLRGMLEAVAAAHAAGLVHRSIGRNSFLLGSTGQDQREATSPYAVVVQRLRVVLADWGFSATVEEAARDKELGVRSRAFGLSAADPYAAGRGATAAAAFARAEDLHALGLGCLAVLFTTLAEPATPTAPLPPTDDDSWQRLFSEIFEADMNTFREYCTNEEVWDGVVALLDVDDRAGWALLGDLLLARERVSDWFKGDEEGVESLVSASSLLSHPFFKTKMR